jgi:hypothetical protein
MFDKKRESDTIQQVALNMDGLTTKNIFRALIVSYRAGYRHAEDDYNAKRRSSSTGPKGTWIEQNIGELVKHEAPHLLTRNQKLLESVLELL